MSKKIILTNREVDEISNNLFASSGKILRVGSIAVGSYGGIQKVVAIYKTEKSKNDGELYQVDMIDYIRLDHKDKEYIHSETVEYFLRSVSIFNGTYEELLTQSNGLLVDGFSIPETPSFKPESTSLVAVDKDLILAHQRELTLKRDNLKSAATLAETLLKAKLEPLKNYLAKITKTVEKIRRFIWTIELYLGIKEEVHHFKQGQTSDEPILLYQTMAYMDEEVGDPTNGGLDFNNIEDFDNWLLAKNDYHGCYNYEFIVPNEKCIRAVKVRRHDKEYTSCVFTNFKMNTDNKKTYLLIRNGENLYRIYSDLNLSEKLFPNKDEFVEFLDKLKDQIYSSEGTKTEQLDKVVEMYKRNFMVLQGLIDRTTILGNLAGIVNLLEPSAIDSGAVKLIYDGAMQLETNDGFNFTKWRDEINSKIEVASRIYMHGAQTHLGDWQYGCDRFYASQRNDYRLPENGVYNLEKGTRREGGYVRRGYEGAEREWVTKVINLLRIKYVPNDTSRSWDWGKSGNQLKNKVSLEIKPKRDNHFIINYDAISWRHLDKIWAMMHDRRNRVDYLGKMGMILAIHERKSKEIAQEKEFAKLVQGRLKYDVSIEDIMDTLHFWKTKNKHRRPLTKDEPKALRMIVKAISKSFVK